MPSSRYFSQSCTRGDRDQSVGALFDRLAGEAIIDHVVQDDAAPAVRGLVDVFPRAQRGDQHGHLPFFAERHVLFEAVVGLVDDLIDREGRGGAVRVVSIVRGERLCDLVQPLVELADGPRVERGEAADNARLALRDDEFGAGNDEQRRTDDGKAQVLEQLGKRHP